MTAFFSINSGGEYPCGNNDGGRTDTGTPKCYILHGSNQNMGSPTVITMLGLKYSSTNKLIKVRILLYNPDTVGSWFTINVKAFKGSTTEQSLIGEQYVGYWKFFNLFQVVDSSNIAQYRVYPTTVDSSNTVYISPSKKIWRDETTWSLISSTIIGTTVTANDYVIF
eukprot:GHVR01022131.1.p1 GENE.GHVR01022131.1~~GHVR01022131.1.p1  ORF type:complete len:167 (-),score=6.48 GHVR01022131.1:1437-1937(-)